MNEADGNSSTDHPVVAEVTDAFGAIREAVARGVEGTYEPLRARGIMVMNFRAEHEERFRLHAELLGNLAAAGKLSGYELWRLDLDGRDGLAGLLIVFGDAGTLNDYSRNTYYLSEAEEFVAIRCGNNWEKINADGTEADVPAPGCWLDLNGASRSFAKLAAIVEAHQSALVAIG